MNIILFFKYVGFYLLTVYLTADAQDCSTRITFIINSTLSSLGAISQPKDLYPDGPSCEAECLLNNSCQSFQINSNLGATYVCWLQFNQNIPAANYIFQDGITEYFKTCTSSQVCYGTNSTSVSLLAIPKPQFLTQAACENLCNLSIFCLSYQLDINVYANVYCWLQFTANAFSNYIYLTNVVEYIKYTDCQTVTSTPITTSTTSTTTSTTTSASVPSTSTTTSTTSTTTLTTTSAPVITRSIGITTTTQPLVTNLCAKLPCGAVNECIFSQNDYICKCIDGFKLVGTKICEEIDECISSPCVNNSVCVNQIDRFCCICPSTNYGIQCEYEKTRDLTNMYASIKPQKLDKHEFSISGGSIVTIFGINLNLFKCYGAFLIPDTNDINATSLYAYSKKNDVSDDKTLQFIVPFSGNNSANIFKHFFIILDYNGYNISLPSEEKLQYIPDPIIDNMDPKTPLIYGNVSIIVSGQNLLGVNPIMIFGANATFLNESISGTFTKQCTVLNDGKSVCPFEGFNYFPDKFKNESNLAFGLKFEVVVSFNMGYYVNYRDGNGRIENPVFNKMGISLVKPSFPGFDANEVKFVPGETLKIKGKDLTVATSQYDYVAKVGLGICVVNKLQNDLLECLPPQEAPQASKGASIICIKANSYELTLSLKNDIDHPFIISCVVYENKFAMPAIIGIAAAASVILIIAIVAICYLFIKKKASEVAKSKNVELEKKINDSTGKTNASKKVLEESNYLKPNDNVSQTGLKVQNENLEKKFQNKRDMEDMFDDGFERNNSNFKQVSPRNLEKEWDYDNSIRNSEEEYRNFEEMRQNMSDELEKGDDKYNNLSPTIAGGEWIYSGINRHNKVFVNNNKRITFTRPQF